MFCLIEAVISGAGQQMRRVSDSALGLRLSTAKYPSMDSWLDCIYSGIVSSKA